MVLIFISGFLHGKQQYRRNTARCVREVLHLLRSQRPSQNVTLPVREPLFEYLVSTQLVAQDGGRDVAPIGAVVEIHVESGVAEDVCGAAHSGPLLRRVRTLRHAPLARHDGLPLPEVPPAHRQREVVGGHVAAARGCGNGDGSHLRPQRARGDAGHGGLRVQQRGQIPASGSRGLQLFSCFRCIAVRQPGNGMRGHSILSAPALAVR